MPLLKEIRRYGLAGGSVSLGMDFRVSEAQARPSGSLSLPASLMEAAPPSPSSLLPPKTDVIVLNLLYRSVLS